MMFEMLLWEGLSGLWWWDQLSGADNKLIILLLDPAPDPPAPQSSDFLTSPTFYDPLYSLITEVIQAKYLNFLNISYLSQFLENICENW